ncbi:MAG: hypothetical protein ABR537_07355 [Gemmatimonadales bacterium]
MLALTTTVASAQIPTDSVRSLAAIHRQVVRFGARYGEAIWPGYRPDTIPVAYVFPKRGTVLLNWHGPLPSGYQSVADLPGAAWLEQQNLGAASTGASLGDRAVAQVVVSSLAMEDLLPVAFHEAFHVFEHASRRPGRRFGTGENSFYVSSYPVFGVNNEMLWTLEGKLLSAALREKTASRRRELARQFVAVRRNRQSQLEPSYAEFEVASEMNEGLAEYALVRALQLLASDPRVSATTRAGATTKLPRRLADVEHLTENVRQSFRLRFYQTGPAEALLLDALAPGWKKRMMEQNLSLQDALAIASGIDDAQQAALRMAVTKLDTTTMSRESARRVAGVIELRRRQVDSVLAAPGVLLELSASALPNKDFGNCGFDPQNHLQISPTVQMQTRWWRPCAGPALTSEFNVPSVHDDETGTVRAVIGRSEDVTLTIDGKPVALTDGLLLDDATNVRIAAPRATVQSARARVVVQGRALRVTPLP